MFYLQDVYRSTQDIPRGTIRRLRVNELIPQPTQRVPYSSRVTFEVLKRVLGTVPVDDNGSVAFEAPAGVPLQFQALDQDGLAVIQPSIFNTVRQPICKKRTGLATIKQVQFTPRRWSTFYNLPPERADTAIPISPER